MSKTLINDTLLQSIGAPLMSRKGEQVGQIVEIGKNAEKRFVDYVIIESKFSSGKRFFSIPASTRFIDIVNGKDLVLTLLMDDIQFAKDVSTDEHPKPATEFGNSIFELHNYQYPSDNDQDFPDEGIW